jgi:hypothetical protein
LEQKINCISPKPLLLPQNGDPIVLNGAVNIGVNDGALVNKIWDTNSIQLKAGRAFTMKPSKADQGDVLRQNQEWQTS